MAIASEIVPLVFRYLTISMKTLHGVKSVLLATWASSGVKIAYERIFLLFSGNGVNVKIVASSLTFIISMMFGTSWAIVECKRDFGAISVPCPRRKPARATYFIFSGMIGVPITEW